MEVTMSPPRPHALLFPFPIQGHVRPFVQLAQCLSGAHGFKVPIANTSHVHKRLGCLDMSAEGDIHSGYLGTACRMNTTLPRHPKLLHSCSDPMPIKCIISDFNFLEAHYTSMRLGIPRVGFSTQSVMLLIIKFLSQKLINAGLLPVPTPISLTRSVRTLQDIANLNEQTEVACARKVTCVPGLHPRSVGELHSVLVTTTCLVPRSNLSQLNRASIARSGLS